MSLIGPTGGIIGRRAGRHCSKVKSKELGRLGGGKESVYERDREYRLQIIYPRL